MYVDRFSRYDLDKYGEKGSFSLRHNILKQP